MFLYHYPCFIFIFIFILHHFFSIFFYKCEGTIIELRTDSEKASLIKSVVKGMTTFEIRADGQMDTKVILNVLKFWGISLSLSLFHFLSLPPSLSLGHTYTQHTHAFSLPHKASLRFSHYYFFNISNILSFSLSLT